MVTVFLESEMRCGLRGEPAINQLKTKVFDLFMRQQGMSTGAKTDYFYRSIKPYKNYSDIWPTFVYQAKSMALFGYLQKEELIANWLVPGVDSGLSKMAVDKVIITNDFDAIPIAECASFRTFRALKDVTKDIYQKPSQAVVPILRHFKSNKTLKSEKEMIDSILQIVATGPRLPLEQL